ncbi:hypothetical protein UB41_15880 [Photobacterium phosphoreum]|nr:hypothetical protein UB41_15880 [Photobacterium phosphoreum]OBU36650.1 hypothetical protein AYY25_18515 [Photobacterium phosphoreum]
MNQNYFNMAGFYLKKKPKANVCFVILINIINRDNNYFLGIKNTQNSDTRSPESKAYLNKQIKKRVEYSRIQ